VKAGLLHRTPHHKVEQVTDGLSWWLNDRRANTHTMIVLARLKKRASTTLNLSRYN